MKKYYESYLSYYSEKILNVKVPENRKKMLCSVRYKLLYRKYTCAFVIIMSLNLDLLVKFLPQLQQVEYRLPLN